MTHEEIKPFNKKLVEIFYLNKINEPTHVTGLVLGVTKRNVFLNVNNDLRGNPELIIPLSMVDSAAPVIKDGIKREDATKEYSINSNQVINWEDKFNVV